VRLFVGPRMSLLLAGVALVTAVAAAIAFIRA